MARRGLSLYDFNDAEFMAVVKDHADNNGYVTAKELADALGFPEENYQSVTVRLGWMRRYGVVERETNRASESFGAWRLTPAGEAAVNAVFNRTTVTNLEKLGDEQMWLLTQFMTNRYADIDPAYANLVRRQTQAGFKKRRL